MSQYKCLVSLSWKFDSDKNPTEALVFSKEQLNSILDSNPKGDNFDCFEVHVELVQLKEKNKFVHLAAFEVDEILKHVTIEETRKEWTIDGATYSVRMNSDRYLLFLKSRVCVACGLIGTHMMLDMVTGDAQPHFNLYAEEDGRLVLMTKDHIVPKSKGGPNSLTNYQLMCCHCNNLKASYDLGPDEVRMMRFALKNPEKLPKQELQKLINRMRDKFLEDV